jgi:hypothetical protein
MEFMQHSVLLKENQDSTLSKVVSETNKKGRRNKNNNKTHTHNDFGCENTVPRTWCEQTKTSDTACSLPCFGPQMQLKWVHCVPEVLVLYHNQACEPDDR